MDLHCATVGPVHSDGELDCLQCGACCRSGRDGTILIPPEDLTRWHRLGRDDIASQAQPGHLGMVAFATTAQGACVHLGTRANSNACSIYEIRAATCRDFEKGSSQCLEYREDHGLEPSRQLQRRVSPGNMSQ